MRGVGGIAEDGVEFGGVGVPSTTMWRGWESSPRVAVVTSSTSSR